MTSPSRRLVLSLFHHSAGHHIAGWRHPAAPVGRAADLGYIIDIARKAETHKYDLFFLADALYVPDFGSAATGRRYPPNLPFEPLTLLSALSVVTRHIGLAATVSTTYSYPYTVARMFASLDHLSNGRAAWNIVTSHSDREAENYGLDTHPPHAERYKRAEEFVRVTLELWNSWDADAFLPDKASGLAFNPDKVRSIDFRGNYFSVKGPLISSRPPQGRPVLIQAGASDPGLELAAEFAEVVFAGQREISVAQAYYKSLKQRMRKYGRENNRLHILPGMSPVVGRTEKEAAEKLRVLQDLIDPQIGLELLSHNLGGIDLSQFDLDAPLPPLPRNADASSRYDLVIQLAEKEKLTLRQLYQKIAVSRGHFHVVGTAEHIADVLESWFTGYAADGFNIMPPSLPDGFDDFNNLVVPILQERGLVQREYVGETLTERLGLVR